MTPHPLLAFLMLALLAAAEGCAGSGPSCKTGLAMGVSPAAATADSSLKAPGNQQQFQATLGLVLLPGSGTCAVPQVVSLAHPAWTSSDREHITISSADDATNGLATCTGPTAGPATLTATLPSGSTPLGQAAAPLTATAELTCK